MSSYLESVEQEAYQRGYEAGLDAAERDAKADTPPAPIRGMPEEPDWLAEFRVKAPYDHAFRPIVTYADALRFRLAEAEAKLEEAEKYVCPEAIQLAIMVLLNHIEPGWDNCKFAVKKWLEGKAAALRGGEGGKP